MTHHVIYWERAMHKFASVHKLGVHAVLLSLTNSIPVDWVKSGWSPAVFLYSVLMYGIQVSSSGNVLGNVWGYPSLPNP